MSDPTALNADALAQEIRRVDGDHALGAGALAEALLPFIAALRAPAVAGEVDLMATSVTAEIMGDDHLRHLLDEQQTDEVFGHVQAIVQRALRVVRFLSASERDGGEAAVVMSVGGDILEFGYTNWRGECGVRHAIPRKVWFGSTEWHPEPQWLLTAFDVEKKAERDFALVDMGHPASPAEGEGVRVKGLEWRDNITSAKAPSLLGYYYVDHDGNEPDEWSLRLNSILLSQHPTAAAAQKAGDDHFESRIRSALSREPTNG